MKWWQIALLVAGGLIVLAGVGFVVMLVLFVSLMDSMGM